jgi:hypothetical protein
VAPAVGRFVLGQAVLKVGNLSSQRFDAGHERIVVGAVELSVVGPEAVGRRLRLFDDLPLFRRPGVNRFARQVRTDDRDRFLPATLTCERASKKLTKRKLSVRPSGRPIHSTGPANTWDLWRSIRKRKKSNLSKYAKPHKTQSPGLMVREDPPASGVGQY